MVCDLGLILERTEGSGLMIVKKITRDSLAEIDGRISVNDTLLKVSMFVDVYMCARPCRLHSMFADARVYICPRPSRFYRQCSFVCAH